MVKNYNEILKDEIKKIKPSYREISEIKEQTKKFIVSINQLLKKYKINAELFIGGSLAKGTLIRKKKQDIDIFLRFDNQYNEEQIKKLSKKVFKKIRGAKIIKGSRNYINIKTDNLIFEVVPTLKISNPKQARNVTDLSFFHVNYIKRKIKRNYKLIDQIILAKAFCHSQGCYGAESYVRGFSGYAIELLICKCKTFVNFIKQISKYPGKIVIDLEKQYKNKQEILRQLNKAKQEGPIIFIDPTFKERNITAGLSKETFEKFKKAGKSFLARPSRSFFEPKAINEQELKEKAKKQKLQFKKILIKTNKQEGDIAGTKLLKFSRLLTREIKKFFDIKQTEFEYNNRQEASFYLILKPKKQIKIQGPPITNKEHSEAFKKKYKRARLKKGRLYTTIKTPSFEILIKFLKKRLKQHMKQMGITRMKMVG